MSVGSIEEKWKGYGTFNIPEFLQEGFIDSSGDSNSVTRQRRKHGTAELSSILNGKSNM
jgi:hypothetical protein